MFRLTFGGTARQPRPAAPATPALVEGLEGRRLLSAALVNGVLTVNGTAGADRIEVERPSADRLRVEVNGARRTFAYAAVQRIDVNALAGNDEVRVEDEGSDAVNKPTRLSGGDGHDRIEGGAGPDAILGGAGNDRLEGNGGNDLIHGEAGNDRLDGGGGADQLSGGDGADDLKGGSGADRIVGGTGNDDFDDEAAAAEILDRAAEDAGDNRT